MLAERTSSIAPSGWSLLRVEALWYAVSAVLTTAAMTVMTRLWRADWSAPFYYASDAIGSMTHFATTIETGWYENQPRMGVPYGQRYHDFPFSDDLHPLMAKVFGWLTGGNWVMAFNLYYLATFVLCALGAVWFLRVVGLSGPISVALSVLFAVAPYHFQRNETHLFLAGYYLLPVAMVIMLRLTRGEPVWGLRAGVGRVAAVLTGRGAGTMVIIALLVYDGIYYAVFVGLLAGAGALLAWWRTRDRRRLGGAVLVGAALLGWCVVALLPDLLYTMAHGRPDGTLVRNASDSEWYALKFLALVMPTTGHPIPVLAEFRDWYNTSFPAPSEYPALGLVAAVGFVGLLVFGLRAIAGPRSGARTCEDPVSRSNTMRALSMLTWLALLLSTFGGLGAAISLVVSPIRGWNRMSIVIALLALAGLGLAVEAFAQWCGRRISRGRTAARARVTAGVRRAMPAVAAVVLVVGVADQSVDGAVPQYEITAASFHSDERFFTAVEAQLPAGAMVFQTPVMPYPESPPVNAAIESDQLRPFLHTKTLRWSGGGIKGRPQTAWPAQVTAQGPEQQATDLAVIGFAGIVVDRYATDDQGRSLEAGFAPYTGAPSLVSQDGRWAYLSLEAAGRQVELSMTPAQRQARAAELVNSAG